jgi:hypothetical protein
MQALSDDVLTLLYPERQLIVVASDDEVEAARRAARKDLDSGGSSNVAAAAARWITPASASNAGGAAAIAGAALGAAAVAAGLELWKARKRAQTANLPYLVVSDSQAVNLRFPNGHPLRKVVYVGDPGVAGDYYPIATFPRVLFAGKVAEAIRLLRSLGATEISIEYLQGFEQGGAVNLSASSPTGGGVDAEAVVNRTNKARSGAKTTMQLSPTTPPHIPSDLVWFRTEPLWQEIANARLESGLRQFTIDVNYTDDFGINAKLEAKIASVGLGLGGSFTEFRETNWKLTGTFAENVQSAVQPASD